MERPNSELFLRRIPREAMRIHRVPPKSVCANDASRASREGSSHGLRKVGGARQEVVQTQASCQSKRSSGTRAVLFQSHPELVVADFANTMTSLRNVVLFIILSRVFATSAL